VFEAIEKFSVVKTLQAIESANVALLLLDATQGVTDQDPRRACDIYAGYSSTRGGGAWSGEYIAFGVGTDSSRIVDGTVVYYENPYLLPYGNP
jgi:hypothetical protein